MATLEGNELVNAESITALMALFGAKYYTSSFYGYIMSGTWISRGTATYDYLSGDGTTFSLTQTGDDSQNKTTKFVVTFGEDSLWHLTLGMSVNKQGASFDNEYKISLSDNSLVFSPSTRERSTTSTTREDYFDAYLRVKKGTKLTVNSVGLTRSALEYGYLFFNASRVC